MTDTTKPETNLRRDSRQMAEAQARLRAEMAEDPQQRAMAEALRLTADERAAIEAAQAAVDEAEVAINAAGFTLARARRGAPPSYDRAKPFSFFQRSPESHRAVARAAVPGLTIDLEEARSNLQNAIRRRNDVSRRVELARMERRRAAKAEHALQRAPVRSLNDGWARAGGKDAAW